MAQITKATGLSNYIDESLLNFGEVRENDVINVKLPYKSDIGYIEYVESSCTGCTKVSVDTIGKTIDVVFTPNKAVTFSTLPVGKTPITGKVVTIMLDPSQKYFIPGPKLERLVNENKPFIKLNISGTYVKD